MNDLIKRNDNEETDVIDSVLGGLFSILDMPTPNIRIAEASLFGALDIEETDSGYIGVCDLPGFDKEDINITLKNGVLTINAKKEEDGNKEGKNYKVRERTVREFKRSIDLKDKVIMESIQAELKDGVLKITADKPQEEINKGKSHRIEIK